MDSRAFHHVLDKEEAAAAAVEVALVEAQMMSLLEATARMMVRALGMKSSARRRRKPRSPRLARHQTTAVTALTPMVRRIVMRTLRPAANAVRAGSRSA